MVPSRRLHITFAAIIAIVVLIGLFVFHQLASSMSIVPADQDYVLATFSPTPGQVARALDVVPAESRAIPQPATSPSPSPKQSPIPDSYTLKVPFTSQAPAGNWDAMHEDACEEASLLIVKRYEANEKAPSTTDAEKELQALVAAGEKKGHGLSITLEQLRVLGEEQYGTVLRNGTVSTDVTLDSIKAKVASGHPVIVGAAGKELHNPNFRNGGPNYHMLVIIGYTPTEFITNDPGTRKGEGYRYSHKVLLDAVHDWDAGNILNGRKAMLTFE